MMTDEEIVNAMETTISAALSKDEEDQKRAQLEDLWEMQGHPKADQVWGLASDLSLAGYDTIENLYSRIVSLVK